MTLGNRLWKFNAGLTKGVVDWEFLEAHEFPVEERRKAMGWVVERGFVRLFEKGAFPEFNTLDTPYFVVKGEHGLVLPLIDGKSAFFTGEGYADDFSTCLNRVSFWGHNDYKAERLTTNRNEDIADYREFDFEDSGSPF